MAGARRWKELLIAAAILALVGCFHAQHDKFGHAPIPANSMSHVAVPPSGAVPRELEKITLPPYVIEAPDQLLIEVIQRSKVTVDGKETSASNPLPVQSVSGPFLVRIDGTVGLGFWGSVPVAGLTLQQASEAIKEHLRQQPTLKDLAPKLESITVIVDVLAYNSKKYYVIFDGGGYGEQVFPFPITGSETVLDALGNIYGLPDIASKRNIWVARRTPHPGQPWQILPVDWIGITQHGITYTNYQVMPGDRIYVKAQRIVTVDRMLARAISPIERLFGITLLGSSTVNSIKGTNTNGSTP